MEEEKTYLLFRGYHAVAASSDLLNRYNIDNRIVRAPINLKQSCSFALLIDKVDEEMAVYLINNNGIQLL